MKKGKQIAYTAAGTFVFLILLDVTLMMWQATPILDVTQYENVIKLRWLWPDLITHFPKTIPADAQNPAFFYRAGFWQGGASIELKLQMPAQFMDDTSAAYGSKANFKPWKSERTMTEANDDDELPFVSRIDKNKKSYQSPDTADKFETYVLRGRPPISLNHGERAGLYIDRINKEITYWAEDW